MVDSLVTNDLRRVADGQAMYSCCCNEAGTILDDLLVYKFAPERVLVVCNASNRGKIAAHFAKSDWLIGDSYSIADIDSFAMLHALAGVAPQLVNESSAPRTAAWLERITARPAVAATLALHTDVEGFAPGPEHSRWG